jgi:Xaa-Pro dipeptidase
MISEFKHKLSQVRGVLKSTGAEAAFIARQPNFAWLACGGEAHVALISERAVGQFLVTPKKVYLFANGIEMPRLLAEVVRGFEVEPITFAWEDAAGLRKAFAKVTDPKKVISDTGELDTQSRPELFPPLRYALHPEEVKRLRAISRQAGDAMETSCRALKPGLSEFAIAGILARECWSRDLTPAVLLVAVDERIKLYRHPLPTAKKLKRHALLVLCARHQGLIVSVSRLVHFGKLPPELCRRHQAVCAVDAAFIGHTRVGAPVAEVFQQGVAAYVEQGFADEWRLHHQGGPCGYQTRDYVGTPTVSGVVLENQAFAWNPSIAGTKSEDTILVTAQGPRILTMSKDWPVVRVEHGGKAILRPDILIR